jgi:isopenicillin-N N-acyltransferase-like protein
VTLDHHISSDRDPARRGFEFGESRSRQVEAACSAYLGLFNRHADLGREDVLRRGADVRDVLIDYAPSGAEEIAAIARGAGQPIELLMAINARTEILGTVPECTVVAVPAQGMLAQNWDYHPDVAPARLVWSIRAGDGWFTTFTEAGILGKVGMNDRGLAVVLNVLSTTGDGAELGVPIHVLLRQILERCSSVEAAIRLLMDTPAASSNAVTLLGPGSADDSETRAATCESTPAGVRIINPEEETLVHTNHCLHQDLVGTDLTSHAYPDTLTRLHRARALAQDGLTPDSVGRVLRDHAADQRGTCRHDNKSSDIDQSVTHASMVMIPAQPAFWVSDGPPCQNPYEAVMLPWAQPA